MVGTNIFSAAFSLITHRGIARTLACACLLLKVQINPPAVDPISLLFFASLEKSHVAFHFTLAGDEGEAAFFGGCKVTFSITWHILKFNLELL